MATPNGVAMPACDSPPANDLEPKVNDLKINNSTVDDNGVEDDDDLVDPWNVESKSTKGVDYDKLISMLGLFEASNVTPVTRSHIMPRHTPRQWQWQCRGNTSYLRHDYKLL